nr:iron chelate uptake ABC transporter family permease subunit [Methylobrevis pamukkalensis]
MVIAGSALLLVAAALAAVLTGPSNIAAASLFAALVGDGSGLSARDAIVLHDVRLPRLVLGALVGAVLAVSGAMMQGLFRNPLADPGLVGVTAGATVAAVAAIVLGEGALAGLAALAGLYFLPAGAFVGALGAMILLYAIATRGGRTSIATLLLAGLAVTAAANAVTGLMIFAADDQQLRDVTFWTLGSLGGATWGRISAVLPFIALLLAAIPLVARGLDALVLGEAEAVHLGTDVERLKRIVIVGVAAACGAAVAVAGSIGFVGIVVPHLLRLVMGPSNRQLLPATALCGAALLVVADALCRILVAPAELPIGILTALIGAPVFVVLLLRRHGGGL